MDGVELVFDDDVFEFIVDKAVEYKLGARGLRSIVESVMMDKMFEMPSQGTKSCHITKEYASAQFAKCNPASLAQ